MSTSVNWYWEGFDNFQEATKTYHSRDVPNAQVIVVASLSVFRGELNDTDAAQYLRGIRAAYKLFRNRFRVSLYEGDVPRHLQLGR